MTWRTSTEPLPASTVSTPPRKPAKNGSIASWRGSRASSTPTAKARDLSIALAWMLGRHLRVSATCLTRRRVSSLTPGLSLSASDTAPFDTPASLATSAIVGGAPGISESPLERPAITRLL